MSLDVPFFDPGGEVCHLATVLEPRRVWRQEAPFALPPLLPVLRADPLKELQAGAGIRHLPRKQRLVRRPGQQLLLQPHEWFPALPIQRLHSDPEEAQHAVRHVLVALRLAVRDPAEFGGDTRGPGVVIFYFAREIPPLDAGDLLDPLRQLSPIAYGVPVPVKEFEMARGEKLLQRSAAREPDEGMARVVGEVLLPSSLLGDI